MSANIHVGGPMSQDDRSQMALIPEQLGKLKFNI
jgi:hypothetical protein